MTNILNIKNKLSIITVVQSMGILSLLNLQDYSSFWYAVDTLSDKNYLKEIWTTGKVGWKN
jgi:hypothetical protein